MKVLGYLVEFARLAEGHYHKSMSDVKNENSDTGYSGLFIVYKNPDEEFDICCEINENFPRKPPKKYRELYSNVELACAIIKSLDYTDKSTKEKYFKKLLSLAQAGLVSKAVNPDLAQDALDKLKKEIMIIEGGRIKNKYMINLGFAALIIALISSLIFAFSIYFNFLELASFALISIGTMAGVWLSFGVRKLIIKFEELSVIEKDMMKPFIRLIFSLLSTLLFALFIMTGIIQVKAGSFDTSNMANDYKVPLIFGAVCGLIENRIGVRIYNQAKDAIGE